MYGRKHKKPSAEVTDGEGRGRMPSTEGWAQERRRSTVELCIFFGF